MLIIHHSKPGYYLRPTTRTYQPVSRKPTLPTRMKFLILLFVMAALFSSVALAGNRKEAKDKYSKNKKGVPHQGV
jgi:hypothetical protein